MLALWRPRDDVLRVEFPDDVFLAIGVLDGGLQSLQRANRRWLEGSEHGPCATGDRVLAKGAFALVRVGPALRMAADNAEVVIPLLQQFQALGCWQESERHPEEVATLGE